MKIDKPFDCLSPKTYRISTVELGKEISVIEIGYNRVPPGLKQIIQRDVYILHYITSGKGVFLGNAFDENSGYLVMPDELEFIEADDKNPYEAYWIMFRGAGAKDVLEKCGLANRNGVFRFNKNKECAEILREALFEINPINELEEGYIMQSAFYRIMAIHMSEKRGDFAFAPFAAQKVKVFIENNYHRQIKMGDLAKKYNLTRNYLYKLFKKEYGLSPQEYLLSLRIEKAKILLKDEKKKFNVAEVAYAVGFNDSLYFSRLFHKRTGMSPTEFKKFK